ncbi:MAG: protein kinase [Oscillospiraceae bacterium]|nr:protein kinase [Oscillospiraceae bacterium]
MEVIRCDNCFEEYSDEYDVCPHCGYVPGEASKEVFQLFPGTVLNERYITGQVLGFGGFGITYKAYDRKLKSVVAIKEYYPSGIVNRAPGTKHVILITQNRVREYNHGLTRFLDEARNMARFGSHPSIINIYEYFEENNTAYLVMEFLDGTTLDEYLNENSLDVDSAIELVAPVCAALKSVHAQGIIHRDVSPDNIFLCTNGAVKLIDFGAARFAANEDRLLTIILKPGFAPPEQYERVNIQGAWTDIYALGATLYYMLTGLKPEESTNRKIQDDLPPPHVVNSAVPENVSNTIMKAMAVDRHMRFSMVEEFEKGLSGSKKIITLAKEKKRRNRRRFVGIFAALLAVAVGGTAFAYSFNRQREEETLPDAAIELWYPSSGDARVDESKAAALQGIIGTFRESFPNVEITAASFPEAEYARAVRDALAVGSPIVFESTNLSDELLSRALELDGAIGETERADCWFLGGYDRYFPSRRRLPLGFVAPVVYVNTTLISTDSAGASDLSGVGPDRGVFLAGDAESYLGDTGDFFDVQAELPARYRLLYLDKKGVVARFTDMWSAAPSGNDERKCALRLLEYMLSDNAQDYLHLRRQSGALPVNKRALAAYCEVYTDFDGFFDNIGDYTFQAK